MAMSQPVEINPDGLLTPAAEFDDVTDRAKKNRRS